MRGRVSLDRLSEPAAGTLGVEAPAGAVVGVDELGVSADVATNTTIVVPLVERFWEERLHASKVSRPGDQGHPPTVATRVGRRSMRSARRGTAGRIALVIGREDGRVPSRSASVPSCLSKHPVSFPLDSPMRPARARSGPWVTVARSGPLLTHPAHRLAERRLADPPGRHGLGPGTPERPCQAGVPGLDRSSARRRCSVLRTSRPGVRRAPRDQVPRRSRSMRSPKAPRRRGSNDPMRENSPLSCPAVPVD